MLNKISSSKRRTLTATLLLTLLILALLCSSLVVSVEAASMWTQTYGGGEIAGDWAHSLVETSDGGFAIAGETHSSSTGLPSLYSDFWLVKTDALGKMEWNKTYGSPYVKSSWAYSLVATSDGGYAIAGVVYTMDPFDIQAGLVKTDALGNMQWYKTYGEGVVYSLIAASDDGYALAGFTGSSGVGSAFWLVKTDEYGVAPEASWVVLPVLLTATLAIFICKKKLLPAHNNPTN